MGAMKVGGGSEEEGEEEAGGGGGEGEERAGGIGGDEAAGKAEGSWEKRVAEDGTERGLELRGAAAAEA